MKYVDAFRHPGAARAIRGRIRELGARLAETQRAVRIMEVCGTHTMAVARYAIREALPRNVRLISGPGCPVCVTPPGYLDAAVALAGRGIAIVTFGDMLNVPGSQTSLARRRAEGARVEVCYSPARAAELAAREPGAEFVFLGVGFETTIGPVASLVCRAREQGLGNLSVLCGFRRILPALEALAQDPEVAVDAFLCPAHVSAVIGADAYRPFARRHRRPCVIAGFEPLDILLGLQGILEQVLAGEARVDNQYARVVRSEGNRKVQALIEQCLTPVDADWRGLGTLPHSGLALRPEYAAFDAAVRYRLCVGQGQVPAGCRCGDVIKGKLTPPECGLFGRACTPAAPVGPCMVSSEGTCTAWYRYTRGARP
ncbi:MAG: hydrogenase formation protein HypD [Kiritimatiellae bacterium]|nr:hydrogenase formation protein HypD [Kiritimatiellia bacterium]